MSIGPVHSISTRAVLGHPLVVVLAAVALCGWGDYATGYEVSFFAAYALPIILASRSLGVKGGAMVAFLCALVWIAADLGAGHRYAQWWVVYWNALHRFVFFLCVTFGFHYARSALGGQARLPGPLAGPLPLCTQCHRVGAGDGHWHRLESYLCEHAGVQPLRKVCPDCAREAYAKAGIVEHASHR